MKKIFTRLLLGLMLTLGGSSAHAGPFEDGVAAYDRGDYATAQRLWRPLAERGHAAARLLLGSMYAEGQGVAQNYREAMKWYRLAAEQGLAVAQSVLGSMYAEGQGVAQNYREAVKWYRLAAERCDVWKWAGGHARLPTRAYVDEPWRVKTYRRGRSTSG